MSLVLLVLPRLLNYPLNLPGDEDNLLEDVDVDHCVLLVPVYSCSVHTGSDDDVGAQQLLGGVDHIARVLERLDALLELLTRHCQAVLDELRWHACSARP